MNRIFRRIAKSKYPHEVTIRKKIPETGGKNLINKRSDK
jgi:hypothetical protein